MMTSNLIQYSAIAIVVIIVVVLLIKRNRDLEEERQRREMRKQASIERVKKANEPGYRSPDDNMETFIENGVIKYRRKNQRS